MAQSLCEIVLSKIDEQIERTDRLIGLLPDGQLDWRPDIPGAFSAAVLLGHLMECLAGFCAVLLAIQPDRLRHFADLRALPVNHRCVPQEARERIKMYHRCIREGFSLLRDPDLAVPVPTVFVREGEALLLLLLGNLEHLINHKHQLFTYLKQMGIDVGTRDLYHFRGE
jgi:DinB superfamily